MPTSTGDSQLYHKVEKKVTRNTETSGRDFDPTIPQAQIGIPVPATMGRRLIIDANTLWTGNMRPIVQKSVTRQKTQEREFGGTTGSGFLTWVTRERWITVETYAVTGYKFDLHMGICLGPGVQLRALYVDGILLWSGTLGPHRQSVTLGASETFLNKATIYFQGGDYDQVVEPLVSVADYPAYTGIATILLKDIRADLPMGQLAFEVTRYPNPLGLSGANNKIGDDLNVVSAIAEVITNPWGYAGLDISYLDTAKLTSMAVTKKNEGNVVSMKIGAEAKISAVLDALLEQANITMYEEPTTSKITGVIVDYDTYDYPNTKKFNMLNMSELRNYNKPGWQDTIEQVKGSYLERSMNYKETSVFLQNTANLSSSGRGKKTASIYYPYVPNRSLAQSLLYRDMRLKAAPVYNYSIVTNRDGAELRPGMPVLVSWPDYDLLNTYMTVEKVRIQPGEQNSVVLDLKQRLYPYTSAIFGEGGNAFDPGFSLSPVQPTTAVFRTAPYHLARLKFGISTSQATPLVYPLILPKPANNNQFGFTAYITNEPNSPGDSVVLDPGIYATHAQLNGTIGLYDDFADGILSSILIDNVVNPANLLNIGSTGVTEGKLFLFMNNEIMSFESCTDNGDGTWTLTNVHRALLDTTFQAHADNSAIQIITNNPNTVGSGYAYPLGFSPAWNIVANSLTQAGLKSNGLLISGWAPSYNRLLAPPRPHNTKVNGTARSNSGTPVVIVEGASCTVTWNIRSRSSIDVRKMLDGHDVIEADQTHEVFLVDSANVVTSCGTDIDNGSLTFTVPNVANGAGFIYVETQNTLGVTVYKSQAQDRIPVTIT